MKGVFTTLAALLLMVVTCMPVQARAADAPLRAEAAWNASYWNNKDFIGQATMTRVDGSINFDWGHSSPDSRINADHFAARWTRWVAFEQGEYRFTVVSDDGVRIAIDGRIVLNEWYSHPAQSFTVDVNLTAGDHLVVVEYYDETGQALIKLGWEQIGVPIREWRGEYFNQASPSGTPVLIRNDADIAFDWGQGSPAPGVVSTDNFSVRWTRALNLPAGWYRFAMTVDDGGKLWANNQLILDRWQVQSQQTFTSNYYHSGGALTLRMEYYDAGGAAVAYLSWSQSETTIRNWKGEYYSNTSLSGAPVLVRDDADINFNWGDGSPAPGTVGADQFSARWTRTINLPAGRYRFTAQADDGVRLWVNDQLLINQWQIQPPTTVAAEVDVRGGPAQIRVEYFDEGGNAQISLTWNVVPKAFRDWRGEYFNNTSLSGTPVLVRDDVSVNFDWGTGSPAPGVVGIDAFSARWTRTVYFAPGWYRFNLMSDDGSRLYADGKMIINAWQVQVARVYSADVYLSGDTLIALEYYDQSGVAMVKMAWETVATTIRNWKAEYYNTISPVGQPVLVRDEAEINHNWGASSPAPGVVNADGFSARWTRDVNLTAGWYRFSMLVDDGGRLWVNNRQLLAAWVVQGPRPYEADIYLPGGMTNIRFEYFEHSGWATAQMSWRSVSGPARPETTIVDDTDAGFVQVSGSQDWQYVQEGFGNRLTWTRTSNSPGADNNVGRWFPKLAPGQYEVFVYIPDRYTTTSLARYRISSAAGTATRSISQRANPQRWVSLGVYTFRGNDTDFIELSDYTGETATYLMAFDAIKWEPR